MFRIQDQAAKRLPRCCYFAALSIPLPRSAEENLVTEYIEAESNWVQRSEFRLNHFPVLKSK